MKDGTRAIRAGLTPVQTGGALHQGPVFASTFHSPGEPDLAAYSYGRSHQPTWSLLEHALAELEVASGNPPAGVRVFASGLAAVSAVFTATLFPGDTVILQAGTYFGTRRILDALLVPRGVRVVTAGVEDLLSAATLAGARLLWLETPGNPGLEIADIQSMTHAAHAAGVLVAVDNTTATPLGQRPLELGADFSVCSDSKALCGHSDLLLGHVATHSAELLERIDQQRNLGGAIAGPMEAWLALRSLATLPLRLERMSQNALAIAEFLAARPGVTNVLYPGLRTHPGHLVARAQMKYFGPVLSFTLNSRQAAERWLAGARLVTEATSFGGITTTAERRARWAGDAVAPGFIRMSAGCEDLEDLIEDLGQAFHGLD